MTIPINRIQGKNKKRVSSRYCKESTRLIKPAKDRKCRAEFQCSRWKSGNWGECDNSCRQQRPIACQERHTRKRLSDERCLHLPKPKKQRGCKKCDKGKWKVSKWSACSATCKSVITPTQSRRVECMNEDLKQLHSSACKSMKRPLNSKNCDSLSPCETEWTVTNWGPCSRTCGNGTLTRLVQCPEFGNCVHEKPEEFMSCNLGSCVPHNCADVQRLLSKNTNGNYKIQVCLLDTYCSLGCRDSRSEQNPHWPIFEKIEIFLFETAAIIFFLKISPIK